ncbi:MAG TPA: hypothetical protein VF006_08455 [Longimicrobium sp.]
MALGLFLLSLWWFGARYEVRPRSEFQPQNVIHKVLDARAAAQLRSTADRLERRADSLEASAFLDTATDSSAKALLARAELYRARAQGLASRASARDAVLARRHAKRLLWLYAASVDVVVCILVGLIAVGATYQTLRTERKPRPMAVAAGMVVLSIPGALLFSWKWYDYATPPYALIQAAVGPQILAFMRGSDGLHILAVTLIMWVGAFTAPAVLRRGAVEALSGDLEIARAAREIVARNGLFRLALYMASAMLVMYVAAVSSLFQWVLAFVEPDQAVAAGVEALANSAVTARALLASGLLVFGFGAGVAMGRVVGSKLSMRALPEAAPTEREAWIQQQGLSAIGWGQQLKTVAAVVAPLVTGVLAQVLQSLV